jgi:ferredoxin-thioredoxin reductase catalytic subunit
MEFYALRCECQAWKDIRQRGNTFCGYFQHKSEKVDVVKQTNSQYGFRNKDYS